jgi:hypothetical protein
MDEMFCRIKGRLETYQILEYINRRNVRGINVFDVHSSVHLGNIDIRLQFRIDAH